MNRLEHDSRASMAVRWHDASNNTRGARPVQAGWYVVRTCPCHAGHAITIRFETRPQAEHAIDVLDDDARRRA